MGAVSIHLTLPPAQLAKLDAWIACQDDKRTRPDAIRAILREHLGE